MEHLLNDLKDWPNKLNYSHKLCDEMAPCCEFDEKAMETETTTWSEFPDGGKGIVEQYCCQKKGRNPRKQDCEYQPRTQIFVKLSFRELCKSKLSGLLFTAYISVFNLF